MKRQKKALSLLILSAVVGGLVSTVPFKEVTAATATVDHQYELVDLKHDEIIKNGDFQNGKSNWDIVGQNSGIDTDGSNKYAKLGKTTDNFANGHIWQDVNLKPNTKYTLKARVKVESDDKDSFVTLDVKKGGSAQAGYFESLKVKTGDWKEVSLTFTTDATTKYAIGIGRWSENASDSLKNSEAFIDDVTLECKDSSSIDSANYDFVWADDFNNDNLNPSDWEYELGSIRGIEQQHYVNDPENVFIEKEGENGQLVLKATDRPKELQYNNPRNNERKVIYNSGSVRTHGKKEFLYGRIEMKAKLPKGQSVFPAFWTLGSDFRLDGDIASNQGYGWARCGEIDIMELIGSEEGGAGNKTVYQTLHTSDGSDVDHKLLGNAYTIDEDFYNDYHIFGMNWSKNKIEFYVDDKIVSSVDYTNDPIATKCLNRPQYIQFNLAMGGAWPGEIAEGLAGTEFAIDYVYYAQNEQQKADAAEYYKNAPRLNGYKDLTIYEGETDPILAGVTAENGTVDFSITDQPQFAEKEKTATANNPLTSVDLLCTGKNDLDSLAKLPAGEYVLYYTGLPENMKTESVNPNDPNAPKVPLASEEYKFDRKAVNLTIKEKETSEVIPATPIKPATPVVPDESNPNDQNGQDNNGSIDVPKTGDTSKTNLMLYTLVLSGGAAMFLFGKNFKKKLTK